MATPNTNAWRYRVGDYRVICDLADEQMVVYVIRPLRWASARGVPLSRPSWPVPPGSPSPAKIASPRTAIDGAEMPAAAGLALLVGV